MLRRILMITSFGLLAATSVASADHWRGGDRGYHGPVVRERVASRPVVVRDRYVRRPIYVQGPVIREHYYNYNRRPAFVVENYGPREGYVWVRGSWSWNGYEWLWVSGHYEAVY
jgi:hypothetical protein